MANNSGLVKLPPDFDLQAQNAAQEWKFWRTAFQDYLVSTGQDQANPNVKLSILRNIIGNDAARIMSTFTIAPNAVDDYEGTLAELEKYVNPRKNECFERYMFSRRCQKEDESFDHFLTECKHLIRTCNYNANDPNQSNEDKALRDRIVMGIKDPVTREALLRFDDLTLDKAIKFCRTSEQSKTQSLQFQDNAAVAINRVQGKKKPTNMREKFDTRRNKFNKFNTEFEQKKTFKCSRCQTKHGPRECPAFGKKCGKCGIENHFAVSCRVKSIRNVEQSDDESSGSGADEELFVYSVNNFKNPLVSPFNEVIILENKKVKIRLDTGADVSVIPLRVFKEINKQFKVRPTQYILKGFEGSHAKPIGIVNLHCTLKNKEIYEDFVIVEGANQILLGGQACVNLNLIKRINNVKCKKFKEKENFINQNSEIFTGFGRFPGKHNIPTKENFENVCHPPTKIPFAIRDEFKRELDRLIERKAIVKVDKIEPEASINRIVIVEKSNGKIRLCLDPSDINSQIVRKPKLGLNIEEISSKLRDKKFFTVFDLAEGYHHLKLNEKSSWKCCFATPFGVYRFIVLPYGLSNSQDLFQYEVEKHFSGLKNVVICHDDMIISGKTKQEHDEAVDGFVKKAKNANAKFNKDKFQYCQNKVKFMGQMFSEEGMQIDPDRIESLSMLKSPENKAELQRVIGSFNYVRRYVKNMSEIMHPLCELLKSNVEWTWLPKHQKAFEDLKVIITKSPALVPFDPNLKTVLQCDASKNGLGCCMFQQYDKNVLKLVACASRSMNDHELNYSQTEKELLSIYFGTKKFHDFIYRQNVDVQSDHKPIVSIMKKPIHKIGSVRLQRLRLKLLIYSLNIYYVPGKNVQFADMLSRSNLQIKGPFDHEMCEMVHSISKHLPMSQEKKDQFRLETSKEPVLTKIFDYYYNGWPKEKYISADCKFYYPLRESLYVEAGIIFIDDKIVVPQSLKHNMMKLLHKGHIGISKTINKARTLFYWPNLSYDIVDFIKKCRVCEKHMPANFKEPLMPHGVPTHRFSKVAADIVEHGGRNYLVVVDHFSHWLELVCIKDKTSEAILNCFQNIFTRFGYPQFIIADNLPFLSSRCKKYYKDKDIAITTCSPHYHQSNGMAEKAVSISKQILKKSFDDKYDFREGVMEYNNSPIISLDATPAQILQSRILRSELPVSTKVLEPKVQTGIYERLVNQKQVMKNNFDKSARRKPLDYKKGDKVVIKTPKEKIWQKAIVIEKARDPKSYWVKKENNDKIVRRNTTNMKHSCTKSDYKFLCEPNLYPNENYDNTVYIHPNNVVTPQVSVHESPRSVRSFNSSYETPLNSPSSTDTSTSRLIDQSSDDNDHYETGYNYRSRFGRPVRPPRKLDL